MADKLVIDCKTFSVEQKPFTHGELTKKELLEQSQQEQELIDNLKPSEKEILMAEIELNTINLLLEMGVF